MATSCSRSPKATQFTVLRLLTLLGGLSEELGPLPPQGPLELASLGHLFLGPREGQTLCPGCSAFLEPGLAPRDGSFGAA